MPPQTPAHRLAESTCPSYLGFEAFSELCTLVALPCCNSPHDVHDGRHRVLLTLLPDTHP